MSEAKQPRSWRIYLSWALFALSAALFVAVALTWYRDRDDGPQTAPIPVTPGHNEAINVKRALEDEDLTVEFGRGGGRAEELTPVGQLFTVDGAELYVFLYPGVSEREEETSGLALDALEVLNTRGTPTAGGPPRVYVASNVVALLYGASDEVAGKVQSAIEGLP
jgi:hypothetical protein